MLSELVGGYEKALRSHTVSATPGLRWLVHVFTNTMTYEKGAKPFFDRKTLLHALFSEFNYQGFPIDGLQEPKLIVNTFTRL
jgi:hypothetical protein